VKILVTGSRDWTDRVLLAEALWQAALKQSEVVVVHGAARGADTLAGDIAHGRGWTPVPVPADWDQHGKAAGPIRNRQIWKEHPDIDVVLAFVTDWAESKGTKDMLSVTASKATASRVAIYTPDGTLHRLIVTCSNCGTRLRYEKHWTAKHPACVVIEPVE
jgi:hypothetical protein